MRPRIRHISPRGSKLSPQSSNGWSSRCASAFGDTKQPESERILAATALAQYAQGDTSQLLELALESAPRQFDIFAKRLDEHAATLRPVVVGRAEERIPDELARRRRIGLAKQKANAIILLHQFGNDKYLWSALAHSADPRIGSLICNYFREVGGQFNWVERIGQYDDSGVRQAVILAAASSEDIKRMSRTNNRFAKILLRHYRDDKDPGVALRR